MFRIIKKEVEIIKEIEVEIEPKIVTLYLVYVYNKEVKVIKDVVFKRVIVEKNGTYLNFIKDYEAYRVYINPETLEVTENNDAFLDYEMAVKVHRERRKKYLKNSIEEFEKEIEENTKKIEECKKLLEEFEKENKDE